jgi:hypothetical protein
MFLIFLVFIFFNLLLVRYFILVIYIYFSLIFIFNLILHSFLMFQIVVLVVICQNWILQISFFYLRIIFIITLIAIQNRIILIILELRFVSEKIVSILEKFLFDVHNLSIYLIYIFIVCLKELLKFFYWSYCMDLNIIQLHLHWFMRIIYFLLKIFHILFDFNQSVTLVLCELG